MSTQVREQTKRDEWASIISLFLVFAPGASQPSILRTPLAHTGQRLHDAVLRTLKRSVTRTT